LLMMNVSSYFGDSGYGSRKPKKKPNGEQKQIEK